MFHSQNEIIILAISSQIKNTNEFNKNIYIYML